MLLGHDDATTGTKKIRFSPDFSPPQVLVVDDTDEVRSCISYFLRSRGYRVLEAEDGLAARSILQHVQPALVISDLEMPVCDGWEVLAYCHAQYPAVPVLIMSGTTLGRRPEIESWAAGFLPKPFNPVRFHAEVERLITLAA